MRIRTDGGYVYWVDIIEDAAKKLGVIKTRVLLSADAVRSLLEGLVALANWTFCQGYPR